MNPEFWDIIHFGKEHLFYHSAFAKFRFVRLTQDEFEKREESLAPEWLFSHEGLSEYGCFHYYYPKEKYWVYAKRRGIIK